MAANPVSLIAYFQQQMIARRLYAGEVNGEVDDALLHAIEIYQQAMGRRSVVDAELRVLSRLPAHRPCQGAGEGACPAEGQSGADRCQSPPQPAGTAPLRGRDHPGRAGTGAVAIPVAIKSAGAAASLASPASATKPDELPFVYVAGCRARIRSTGADSPSKSTSPSIRTPTCTAILLDENQRVNQFFPNPAQPRPRSRVGTRMQFPGAAALQLRRQPRGAVESVACFASPAALGAEPLKTLSACAQHR